MATVEKLEKCKVKLTIEVDSPTFDNALQDVYLKTRGKYSVPGFRKGKAPRKVIENMYGDGVFYEEAFDKVYPDAFDKAVEENNLDPVDRPDLSIEQIGMGETLIFTAEVDVRPEVVLGDYKGIEVVRRAYTVEDIEITGILEQEREKIARYVEQERPIQDGDRVILDYSGSVDGVKFQGGTAEDQTLDIGSGTFIPGFEEQLVGMTNEQEADITVTFPEEYHAEELKGKAAVFAVKIKAVQTKELPEFDDDFAQDISEFNTLDELRADKREQLRKRNDERARAEMEDEAVRKATANATFDVPNAMIERQMDYMLQDIAYRLSMSGLSLNQYCQYMGTDPRTLRETYREDAQNRVRTQLVLSAIREKEGIESTQEEIDVETQAQAKRAGQEVATFAEKLTDEDKLIITEHVELDRTIKLLMDNAVMVDAPPQEEEKKD